MSVLIIKWIVTFIAIYALYCVLLFVMQRYMIFPRFLLDRPPQPDLGSIGIRDVWLDTPHGKVEAWYFAPRIEEGSKHPAIITAHGNGELIDNQIEEALQFQKMGAAVLLVEYPGYGRSEGSPGKTSIVETFVLAYDFLADQPEIDRSKIVLFGRSLGGGAVCALSEKRPCAAMILVSTFTSITRMAKKYLAPPFLIRDPFDNLVAVSAFEGPILFFHGEHDSVIPYTHGKTLYEAAQNGTLTTYDCDHNDLPPDMNAYTAEIESFLRQNGLLKRPVSVFTTLCAKTGATHE